MPGGAFEVDIRYDIKWPKELLQKGRSQEMIDKAGREVVREIKRNIMDSNSIYGGRLAPLKQSTIDRKKVCDLLHYHFTLKG